MARLVCLLVCMHLVATLSSVSLLPGHHAASPSSSSWLMHARALRIDLDSGEQFDITEVVPPNTVWTFQFQLVDPAEPLNVLLVNETVIGDVAAAGEVQQQQQATPLATWVDKPEGVHTIATRDAAQLVRIVFACKHALMSSRTSVHFYMRTRINFDHVADVKALDPIEQHVRALTASMQHLQTVQMRLRQQQRAHRATVERANTQLLMWSVFQVLALLVMSAFQLFFLKRFLERKTFL